MVERSALRAIQNEVGLPGIIFKEEFKFIKKHVADFFGVDERTINYYLNTHSEELINNGYEVLSLLKKSLQKFSQTLVLITHDVEVANMADRIIRIEDGKIIQDEVRKHD